MLPANKLPLTSNFATDFGYNYRFGASVLLRLLTTISFQLTILTHGLSALSQAGNHRS